MNNNDEAFEELVETNETGLTSEEIHKLLLASLVLSAGGQIKIPAVFLANTAERVKDIIIEGDTQEWTITVTTDDERMVS